MDRDFVAEIRQRRGQHLGQGCIGLLQRFGEGSERLIGGQAVVDLKRDCLLGQSPFPLSREGASDSARPHTNARLHNNRVRVSVRSNASATDRSG